MDFNEWWRKIKDEVSESSIPGEVRWFAHEAWDFAIEEYKKAQPFDTEHRHP